MVCVRVCSCMCVRVCVIVPVESCSARHTSGQGCGGRARCNPRPDTPSPHPPSPREPAPLTLHHQPPIITTRHTCLSSTLATYYSQTIKQILS